ncbi:hypothetical protein N0V88_003776 [Collariella sp. IMI 366227]|nr:hypothetical protein N0V88_003776 [Collariella sp. IMI 366227]
MATIKPDPWSAMHLTDLSDPVDLTKPYDPSTLSGKTVLITGGASGFGAAFARHWASYGAHLIIGDVNDAAGEALVADLRTSPFIKTSQVLVYQHCDVTSWASQLELFQTAIRASPTGTLDAVVAGAGIVERGAPTDPQARVFDHPPAPANLDPSSPPPLKVLGVNVTGVMYTTHLALSFLSNPPNTQPSRDKHILLISSIAGLLPLPGQTEYTISKHAVMGLFRTLRATAWPKGIRVNALNPYFVETPLLPPTGMMLLAGGGKGTVEDVVDAATRLMADSQIKGKGYLAMINVIKGRNGFLGTLKDLWRIFVTGKKR